MWYYFAGVFYAMAFINIGAEILLSRRASRLRREMEKRKTQQSTPLMRSFRLVGLGRQDSQPFWDAITLAAASAASQKTQHFFVQRPGRQGMRSSLDDHQFSALYARSQHL